MKIRFLLLEEVLEIHRQEIESTGGAEGINDVGRLKSALGAAQASFDGRLLMAYSK